MIIPRPRAWHRSNRHSFFAPYILLSPFLMLLSTADIAWLCAAGLVLLAPVLWLGVRCHRGRLRETRRALPLSSVSAITGSFSRNQKIPSIVLPEPAVTSSKCSPADDLCQPHQESGIFPRPLDLRVSSPANHMTFAHLSIPSSPSNRSSAMSMSSTSTTSASINSVIQSMVTGTRTVRQLFDPVLPDELLITHVGERLNILQSFDDGWCVVDRELNPIIEPDVELGFVPTCCFLKPAKGMKAEKPVRVSSLGITVQLRAHRPRLLHLTRSQ